MKSSDSDSQNMDQSYYTQGGSLHSVPDNKGNSTEDQYAEFLRAMNDSGVSVSGDTYQHQSMDQYHYYGDAQQYGQEYDYSKQTEEYLKQWAAYYESLQGQHQQIRYDYKTFQNQSDPDEISHSGNEQAAESDFGQNQSTLETSPQPQVKKKIAMISPSFNFVKASSDYKSTEISEKEEKQKNVMIPTVLAGKNRLGLGALNKKSAKQSTLVSGFIVSGKGTAQLEVKFNNLCREVKNRNNPNKNAIEVIHQSADRCKMPINNVFHTNDRMSDGRVKYTCNLEISGVFISSGGAPSKKVAKMEAYSTAMTLFTNPPVTVKEEPAGQFCLLQKVEIGPVKPEPVKTDSHANKTTSQNQAAKQNEDDKLASYSKPKMIFHKASEPVKPVAPAPGSSTAHPLSDKPLEFKKTEAVSTASTKPSATVGQGTAAGNRSFNQQPYGRQGFSNTQDSRYGSFQKQTNQRSGFQRQEFQSAGQSQLKRGGDKFDKPSAVKKVKQSELILDDLSEFIIMDYSRVTPHITATSILHNSANFNRVVLKYQFEEIAGFGWRCNLILSDNKVASVLGTTKEDAKKAAGEEALSSLREICYSIVVKQDVDNDEEGLTKDELVSEIKKGGNVIPDNNIGNMLLRKMGWSGGGVGKHGTGIAEPIKADQVIGREGFGLTASKGIDKSFHQKVQDILVNYTKSNDQNDLHFSPEFTKEERAIIHKAAQKYGLKSHSKGKDEARYLIISRKRSAGQLLDHVMSSGGTTSKYEVIPPSKQDESEDYFPRDREAVWGSMSYGHSKQ